MRKAKLKDGDAENRLVEILYRNKNKQLSYRISKIHELVGVEDKLYGTTSYSEEMDKASRNARKKLPLIKKYFNQGLKDHEHISLKSPFKHKDGREWMWVVVMEWKSKKIKGILNNTPYHIKNLKQGDEVEINEDDVFDYIHYHPDGSESGGFSTKVIDKYSK